MDELFRSTADSSWHNDKLINELKEINIPEVDYFPIDNNIFRVFRKHYLGGSNIRTGSISWIYKKR